MIKKLTLLFLSVSLILFSISYNTTIFYKNFKVDNVKNSIEYLSSTEFKGRLGGTLENSMAGTYLKSEFKKIGLSTFNNSYYHSFNTDCPKQISGDPLLAILDNNNKQIKKYSYGIDFKESMLNFDINKIDFNMNNVSKINENFIEVKSNDKLVLLYVPKENDLSFRSSFFGRESKCSLWIDITKDCYNDLITNLKSGNTVTVSIPYTIENYTLNNVVGVIKGTNSSLPPLIISGHYDHVGSDLNGNIYNGALDNASGTSFVLELARYIKTLGTPTRNIIFVLFNGEELGLKGSSSFANDNIDLISKSRIYNFDMIGSDDGIPLCLTESESGSTNDNLVCEIVKLCKDKKVNYNCLFENSSDHAPFGNIGLEAITLCDYDTTKIHTPEDTIDYIKDTAITRCFTVIQPQLINEIYGNNPLYTRPIIMLTSCGILSIIFLILYIKPSNKIE